MNTNDNPLSNEMQFPSLKLNKNKYLTACNLANCPWESAPPPPPPPPLDEMDNSGLLSLSAPSDASSSLSKDFMLGGGSVIQRTKRNSIAEVTRACAKVEESHGQDPASRAQYEHQRAHTFLLVLFILGIRVHIPKHCQWVVGRGHVGKTARTRLLYCLTAQMRKETRTEGLITKL